MRKSLASLFILLLLPALLHAAPPGRPDIVVMTQNQYLGADLTPIITAGDEAEYNQAMLDALAAVAANRAPERVAALADSVLERRPHLVGLQEMFRFNCLESGTWPGACQLFDAAMNDHLALMLEALGPAYRVAAVVDNLVLDGTTFPYPGLPVFLDDDPAPEVFIQVFDRDVILARDDVDTQVAALPCLSGKISADGCNYQAIAAASALGALIEIQRGYVAVDARVDDRTYRFVNTHLEVQYPAPDPDAPLIQAMQATELMASVMLGMPQEPIQVIVVGDINSDPSDPVFPTSFGFEASPPYRQLAEGVDFTGSALAPPLTDTWWLRPGQPPGDTCCQAADLSNGMSMLDERIDVIFTLREPARVKANVLDNEPEDRTPSGLWPSDHAGVVARLFD